MERPTADWERIEAEYRAGVKSLREIAKEYGISDTAIRKKAKANEWVRDLSAKIAAKADELVRTQEVRTQVRTESAISEREVINANAQAIANVKNAHRADITRQRNLVNSLMTELEAVTDNPELFATLGELMESPDERGVDKIKDAYKRVISMSQRITGIKTLAEALRILIALERESWGIVTAPTPQESAWAGMIRAIQGSSLPIVENPADDDEED